MSNELLIVKYARNADASLATAALSGLDGRPDIPIGGFGQVTDQELRLASSHGIVLEVYSEEEARAEGYEPPERDPEEKPLAQRSHKELDAIAEEERIDLDGAKTIAEKVERIEETRTESSTEEGPESLPATATPPGAGGASGGSSTASPAGTAGGTGGIIGGGATT